MNERDTGWNQDKIAAAAYEAWLGLYTDDRLTIPATRAGTPGQVWKGNLGRAIRDACDLPPGHRGPINRIIEELRCTGNLAPLDYHRTGGNETPGTNIADGEQTVWIPDVWRSRPTGLDGAGESDAPATATPATTIQATKIHATAGASGQPIPGSSGLASAQTASPDRRRGTHVATFNCPHCPFAALTEQALRTHEKRLEGHPHPVGRYACPMCPAVYTQEPAASAHARRDHQVLGVICWTCSRTFPDRSSWSRHRRTEHPREDAGPSAGSRSPDATGSAAPENSAELRETLEEVRQAVRTVTHLLQDPPHAGT